MQELQKKIEQTSCQQSVMDLSEQKKKKNVREEPDKVWLKVLWLTVKSEPDKLKNKVQMDKVKGNTVHVQKQQNSKLK